MKKLFATLIVVVMALSMIFVLVACTPVDDNPPAGGDKTLNLTAMEKKLLGAEAMSLAELEAVAKAEFAEANTKFYGKGLSSGLGKVLKAFKAKYDWFDYDVEFAENTLKDVAMYQTVENTVVKGEHFADIIMTQDGSSLSAYIENGSLLSYTPNDSSIKLDADDMLPLAAVYFNKVFMFNKSKYTTETLTNVWQLTGKNGATKKGMPGISFQDPSTESINMEFLIMMTSEDAQAKLATAYKNYFGKDYTDQKGYDNIGFYFISELLGNVKAWHTSDTTEGKTNLATNDNGMVFYIGVNKLKDYGKDVGVDKTLYKEQVAVPGLNGVAHLDGFDGFTYKMWLMIPKTSKLPFTAALFARYLLTQEGYASGWKDMGYYSANQNADHHSDDLAISEWKANCLVEDIEYINSVYTDVSAYVKSIIAK